MSPAESTSGQRVIITGASSGIGIETAEALAEARAEITLAVRNPTRARKLPHGFVYQRGIQRFTFAGLISPTCILYALSLPLGAGRCISS